MKVSELITLLQGQPQDEQVIVETDAGGEIEFYPISTVKATTAPSQISQENNLPDPSFTVLSMVERRLEDMTDEEKEVALERWNNAPLNEGD
jgi:hypothetical protein